MKRVLVTFLAVRLLLLGLGLLNGSLPYFDEGEEWRLSAGGFRYRQVDNRYLDPAGRWDSNAYLHIAYRGYDAAEDRRSNTAFFPGYPWLIGFAARVVTLVPWSGLRTHDAAFHLAHAVSSLCFLLALMLFYHWARILYDEEVATRAGILLAVAPASLVFHCILSESAFLLALLATSVAAERQRWVSAALSAGLCTAVRFVGATILLPLTIAALVEARWRIANIRVSCLWFLFVPYVFFCIVLHMAEVNGNPWAYFDQQREFFGHKGLPSFRGVWQVFDPRGKSGLALARDLLQIAYIVFAACGIALMIRGGRPRRNVAFYLSLVGVLFAITLLSGGLTSMPRYVSILFPVFAAWSVVLRGRRFWVVAAVMLALQAVLWVTWVHNYPVVV